MKIVRDFIRFDAYQRRLDSVQFLDHLRDGDLLQVCEALLGMGQTPLSKLAGQTDMIFPKTGLRFMNAQRSGRGGWSAIPLRGQTLFIHPVSGFVQRAKQTAGEGIGVVAGQVAMILTGLGGFSTAAGHIGPEIEAGHDISMLVPEIWCRLRPEERDPHMLIRDGLLEKLEDREYRGAIVPVSRLGYRITSKFVRRYFGRVFDNPLKVFDEQILCPETQDLDSFLDGVLHIAEAQQRVANIYFEDGSYELACPPLQGVLSIMAHGHWNGLGADAPEFRRMFTREYLLTSDWYAGRLQAKQRIDIQYWQARIAALESYLQVDAHASVVHRMGLNERLESCRRRLAECQSPGYLDQLQGTLGAESFTEP